MNLHSPPKASRIVTGAGILLIVSIALVVYAPSLKAGFRFVDDYTYLYWAGTKPLPQYFAFTLDPRLQNINYRPVRRMLVLAEYELFHSDAAPYHLAQVLIHAANAALVSRIVWRASAKWRLAFLSGMFFAATPIAGEAVLWISDEAPLAAFFTLAAVLFWLDFVRSGKALEYLSALGALVLALLSKESSLAAPLVFFLIDRLWIRKPTNLAGALRRYAPIVFIMLAYLVIQYNIQIKGTFANEGGYGLGPHIFSNYAAYLAMLILPWGLHHPSSQDVFLWATGLVLIGLALLKRDRVLVLLVLTIIAAIGPVVLASLGPGARYLYLATVPLAIGWALFVESTYRFGVLPRLTVAASLVLASLIILNASDVADAAAELAETSRQTRVPFRDIIQQNPMFSENTRLFLIEPPADPSMIDIAGMFFLRYGPQVSVGGTFRDGRLYTGGRLAAEKALLREYPTTYVYYFDANNQPTRISVDQVEMDKPAPELPCDFEAPLRLEGYEITSSTIRKDQPLALILYWRALGKIDKDYTVFVHLVDGKGQILVGEDSAPRSGKEQTSRWLVNQFTADAHVLSIPQDIPAGDDYRLEIGLYDLTTLRRLSTVDPHGDVIADKVVIAPFKTADWTR